MNLEIKQRWIEALTGGDYLQTKGRLRGIATQRDPTDPSLYSAPKEGFCCLGVLCDLHSRDTGVAWTPFGYFGQKQCLPLSVKEWSGYPLGSTSLVSLAYLNDTGKSFSEIAKIIEENF